MIVCALLFGLTLAASSLGGAPCTSRAAAALSASASPAKVVAPALRRTPPPPAAAAPTADPAAAGGPGTAAAAASPTSDASSAAATALAMRVQAAYSRRGDLTAAFTQVYTDALRKRTRSESGHLWAKNDGRVRWSYESGSAKDFVYNGSSAFFYEPENAQVTVFEAFADSPLAHAMQFLWGAGDLSKTFEMCRAPAAADVPAAAAGQEVLLLRPKGRLGAVDHVYLRIDEASLQVKQTRVVDPLGNVTDYLFRQIKFGPPIDPARFAFSIPAGVQVLRAPASR